MATTNDLLYQVLKEKGYSGPYNQMLFNLLGDKGTLNDRQVESLRDQGYTGTLNDMMVESLRAAGGTGTLNDMLYHSPDFWAPANPSGDAFVMEVQTTGAAETFTLPAGDVGIYNAVVDWGDGTQDTITAYNDPLLVHTYADLGVHEIQITGSFPWPYFNDLGDKLKLVSILNWGDTGFLSLFNAFKGCTNLASVTSVTANTANVTSMFSTFRDCSGLTTLDVSGFDTSNVANISYMFGGCTLLTTLDVSGFDTSNSAIMAGVFQDCTGLTTLDVTGFDTSNAAIMDSMFQNCPSLTGLDVSAWQIPLVTTADNFMNGSGMDIATYDQTLINWEAQAHQQRLTIDFGTSQYTSGGAAEAARTALINNDAWLLTDGGVYVNPYGDAFVMEVETTGAAETFTLPAFNTGTYNAVVDWGDGTQDTITAFNDPLLVHTYADLGVHEIQITGSFPRIYFNNVGDKLKVLSVLNWGDTGFTSLNNMFWGCSNLVSATSFSANTTGVTSTTRAFRDCTALTTVDVSGFDTSNAGIVQGMFRGCTSLTTVDVSGFDATKFSIIQSMFQDCPLSTGLDVSSWQIPLVTSAPDFMKGSGMDTAVYDQTLINWEAQPHQTNVRINFGTSLYTAGGAAEAARTALINDSAWLLTDGGVAP